MAIIPRVAIYSQGSWFYLPPYALAAPITPQITVISKTIPFGGISFPYRRNQGFLIDVSGLYRVDTIGDGLAWQAALRDALFGTAGGNMPLVDFCRFVDNAGVNSVIFRSCACTTAPVVTSGAPGSETFRSWSFSLTSGDPAIYNTGSGGSAPPAGPYEADLPSGETGGGAYVPLAQTYHYAVQFPGAIEAVTAGNAETMQKTIVVTGDAPVMYVTGIRVSGSGGYGGSLPSKFRVSDATHDGGGNYLEVSLPGNKGTAALATGSLAFTPGGTAYIFPVDVSGEHSDVTVDLVIHS
jgi:hypothetical protein